MNKYGQIKATLRRLYHGEKKTLNETAAAMGFSYGTAHRLCRRLGFALRSRSHAQRMRRKVPVEAIESLRRDGLSGDVIAQRLRINRKTVYSRLAEMGLSVLDHDPRKVLTVEEAKEALDRYNRGERAADIAAHCGVSQPTIHLALRSLGYRPRPRGEAVKRHDVFARAPQIVAAYERPRSIREVAELFRCGESTVVKVLDLMGVRRVGRRRRGARSPHWKGGISGLYELVRRSSKAELWRRAVLKRDGHRCRITRRAGVPLEVHHVTPFTVLLQRLCARHPELDVVKDVEKLAALARDFKPLWSLKNGITIGRDLHEQVHRASLPSEPSGTDPVYALVIKALPARRVPRAKKGWRRRWGAPIPPAA